MERRVGTVSRGIRCPIIREGDNLVDEPVQHKGGNGRQQADEERQDE